MPLVNQGTRALLLIEILRGLWLTLRYMFHRKVTIKRKSKFNIEKINILLLTFPYLNKKEIFFEARRPNDFETLLKKLKKASI